MNTCAICRTRFEAESPAVLFISAYGSRRVLCPSCEALLDAATAEEHTPEKAEARAELDRLSVAMKDPEALNTLSEILSGELLDEDAPTDEQEAEMAAAFEEVAREEEELTRNEKPENPILSYLPLAVFGITLIAFVVWFYFF